MAKWTFSRRGFLAAAASAAGAAVGTGYYASMFEPFWLDVHNESHNLPDWPTSLEGLRIAHLTDLHLDAHTPRDYLRELTRRIRDEIKPHLVAFTGDLTTHDPDRIREGAQWLAGFGVPTFVCLGNHDYDPATSVRPTSPSTLADDLGRALEGTGVVLLRNGAVQISIPVTGDASSADTQPSTRPARNLWVAGVEDFYTGRCDGQAAVREIPAGEPRLMLCHNPDAWRLVDGPTAGGLILAGHTHGGQIRLPLLGPLLLPIQDRSMAAGPVKLPVSRMYVSRGVGYLLRCRFNCRPELAVHRVLVRKPGQAGA